MRAARAVVKNVPIAPRENAVKIKSMKISFSKILSVAVIPVLVLSLFAGIYFIKQAKETVTLPVYGAVPEFKLTDTNGAPFDVRSLIGKPWVAAFMFTHCPDQCPLMVLKLAKLSKTHPGLKFVSFTSDPERDQPEVLAEYLKRGIGPANWSYLTGEKTELQRVASALMVTQSDSPNLHSTRFFLIDGAGQIRGAYDSQSKEQLDALAIDVRGL